MNDSNVVATPRAADLDRPVDRNDMTHDKPAGSPQIEHLAQRRDHLLREDRSAHYLWQQRIEGEVALLADQDEHVAVGQSRAQLARHRAEAAADDDDVFGRLGHCIPSG
jgi:hypothetical protein